MHATRLSSLLQFKTSLKILNLVLLVAAADFFFFRAEAGWTYALFGFLLLGAAFLHNEGQIISHLKTKAALCAGFGLLFALLLRPGALVIGMFVLTVFSLAVLISNPDLQNARSLITGTPLRMFLSIGRLCRDILVLANIRMRSRRLSGTKISFIRRWLMPLMLSALFILLFAAANPIITRWLSAIDWEWMATYFSLPRMFFWLYVAAPCWAIIRPHMLLRQQTDTPAHSLKPLTLTGLLFNEHSVFTALILFNGLFLIQNLLDVAFLWSGAALPSGMNYAAYAHQGAYPLVATALLAALFVLIALKPGSATEQQARIRMLVYAWVGQNVFLVLSSIVRLNGYIQEFSLTYLRVAALIWMGLVAIGLMLIIARIYFGRSNLWLINANTGALYATLYACCFISFGSVIANYNVNHCREMGGTGASLDVRYLEESIGMEALPALIRYSADHTVEGSEAVRHLQIQVAHSLQDWRQWTVQLYRLGAYTAQD